jgi:hypothetical protein
MKHLYFIIFEIYTGFSVYIHLNHGSSKYTQVKVRVYLLWTRIITAPFYQWYLPTIKTPKCSVLENIVLVLFELMGELCMKHKKELMFLSKEYLDRNKLCFLSLRHSSAPISHWQVFNAKLCFPNTVSWEFIECNALYNLLQLFPVEIWWIDVVIIVGRSARNWSHLWVPKMFSPISTYNTFCETTLISYYKKCCALIVVKKAERFVYWIVMGMSSEHTIVSLVLVNALASYTTVNDLAIEWRFQEHCCVNFQLQGVNYSERINDDMLTMYTRFSLCFH